jgi:membrane protein YqaA with SNARE-associated domain
MWLQTLMEVMTALVQTYGYLGIFISVAITSATIILPIPGYVTVLFAGPFLNPYIVALVAGLGAAIGEITSYLLGLGGRKIIGDRNELHMAQVIYRRYGVWTIYLFAATPLPFDIIGIICGALEVNLKTFFLLTFAGKVTLYVILAETGTQFFEAISGIIQGEFNPYTIVFLVIALACIIIPFIFWRLIMNRVKPQQIDLSE